MKSWPRLNLSLLLSMAIGTTASFPNDEKSNQLIVTRALRVNFSRVRTRPRVVGVQRRSTLLHTAGSGGKCSGWSSGRLLEVPERTWTRPARSDLTQCETRQEGPIADT